MSHLRTGSQTRDAEQEGQVMIDPSHVSAHLPRAAAAPGRDSRRHRGCARSSPRTAPQSTSGRTIQSRRGAGRRCTSRRSGACCTRRSRPPSRTCQPSPAPPSLRPTTPHPQPTPSLASAQVVQRDFDAQESSLDVGSKGGGAPHWPLIETHSLLQTFRPEHQPQPSAPWHDSHGCAAQ